MLIAADIGGTHARLALFDHGAGRPHRVVALDYPTRDARTFDVVLEAFLRDAADGVTIEAAAIAVAGPVVAQQAHLTNVGWQVQGTSISARLGTPRVQLLNDLEALATAVPVLHDEELVTLHPGHPDPMGNAAVIAAGTGLGQAMLTRIDGRLRVMASEAGHADFAARTPEEWALAEFVAAREGRVQVEHVLSGPGLRRLHAFTHQSLACRAGIDATTPGASAQVSAAALSGACDGCVEALAIFVRALGAEAGNLALRSTATAGLFVGGGIAPRILPALQTGRFLDAFLDKAPMESLVARVPVRVIVNEDAGLLGAAVAAAALVT